MEPSKEGNKFQNSSSPTPSSLNRAGDSYSKVTTGMLQMQLRAGTAKNMSAKPLPPAPGQAGR